MNKQEKITHLKQGRNKVFLSKVQALIDDKLGTMTYDGLFV